MKRKDAVFVQVFLLLSFIVIAVLATYIIIPLFVKDNLNGVRIHLVFGIALAVLFVLLNLLSQKMFPQTSDAAAQAYKSRQLEAVGYLSQGFAHEYGSMFAAILGAAEILQRTASAEQKEYVDIILKTVKRAANLSDQLFGSEIKNKIEIVSIDMHKMLRSVIDLLEKNRAPNIRFYQNFDAESWNITGNWHEIKNAMINLGVSAVKSIGDEEGTVCFKTKTTEFSAKTKIGNFMVEPGKYFTISVEDTGSGFSFEKMKKVFDQCFVATEKTEDIDIRIASVIATVEQHGGAVLAQAKENSGSIFTIYLPFSNQNHKNSKLRTGGKKSAKTKKKANTPPLIMVVDDDPMISKVVTAMLNRMGYSVIQAESGFEALDQFKDRDGEIALIVLDLIMPNMDGVSCFYNLKKIDKDVKVLVSSASMDNSSIEDMEKDGICGFIKKPYLYSELEEAVANILQS